MANRILRVETCKGVQGSPYRRLRCVGGEISSGAKLTLAHLMGHIQGHSPKNTYRVLLSRGLKGCYVHFLDEDTRRFVEGRIDDDELPNVVRGPDDPDEGPDTLAAEPRGPYGND